MHYIHATDKYGRLYGASPIPSTGMSHPLNTTTYRGWAN